MFGFAVDGDDLTSRLDPEERSILTRLASDVATLIADDGTAHPLEPGVSEVDPIAHLDFSPATHADEDFDLEDDDIDPALSRVFPPMSLTDPELAGELRRLTMPNIRQGKLANLGVVVRELRRGGDVVRVRPDEVGAWLAALTDMRLVLASRLEIEDDDAAVRVHRLAVEASRSDEPIGDGDDEMELAMAALYAGLTWWQESLLDVVPGAS